MNNINQALQKLIDKESKKANTHGILLGVQSADGRVNFQGGVGNASAGSSYFIASITKMYTVVVIMQLVDEGKLKLDDLLSNYLSSDLLDSIHVYKGYDYSHQLKIYQLVHQTSGLADYFKGNFADDFKQNRDRAYSVSSVLDTVREMQPAFAPNDNAGRKSYYSDTNYQLLGAIIESVTGISLAENFQARIIAPLGLSDTYLYDCANTSHHKLPVPLYHQAQQLSLPFAITSERGAGGIVSTLHDSVLFMRAYFDGELFDSSHFKRMMQWNSLFFPMQYGYGLMRFKIPRWMNLFRETPELIGHSGSSGSFAFYAPKTQIYMVGTFNQFDAPQRPFQFMMKVLNIVS